MNEALSGPASESLVEVESNAAGKLKRVKTIVEDQWVAVLHRQAYFHAMTRDPALAEALSGNYAAHVHNTIADIFVIALICEMDGLTEDVSCGHQEPFESKELLEANGKKIT